MKFVRRADVLNVAETALDVRRVDGTSSADFARVVCGGFGMPPSVEPSIAAVSGLSGWSCYVAYDGNEPAAAGALFVSGGVGWLGLAATLPDHRRKGGQGAILAARIDRARELGVRMLVTETGVREEGRASNSYRNILRSGFEEAYVRENYLSPSPA
jgi:GNAT superfamily N-acetyltransferase